jgi:hypothetical protein
VQRLERGAMAALRRNGERSSTPRPRRRVRGVVSAASDIAAGDQAAAEEDCSSYPVGRRFTVWSGARGL